MTTQAIMKKVAAKEESRNDYVRCLRVNICPKCGEKMTLKVHGSDDQYSDHNCTSCSFKDVAAVLY